eukprot:m51a1_g6581 hypothetical protein (480) ;mRNA; f:211926-221945
MKGHCNGLRAANDSPVPLTGVAYEAEVLDYCVQVRVLQRYCNSEQGPVEATYDYLLDQRASVTAFAAHIDGKIIRAVVQEKQQAQDTYDAAIASGSGAYMLSKSDEHRDMFRASVGSLPPAHEALVELTYVTEASALPDGSGVRLCLPGGPVDIAAPQAPSAYSDAFPAPFSVSVHVDMAAGVRAASSPTHSIAYEALRGCREGRVAYRATLRAARGPDGDLALWLRLPVASSGPRAARVLRSWFPAKWKERGQALQIQSQSWSSSPAPPLVHILPLHKFLEAPPPKLLAHCAPQEDAVGDSEAQSEQSQHQQPPPKYWPYIAVSEAQREDETPLGEAQTTEQSEADEADPAPQHTPSEQTRSCQVDPDVLLRRRAKRMGLDGLDPVTVAQWEQRDVLRWLEEKHPCFQLLAALLRSHPELYVEGLVLTQPLTASDLARHISHRGGSQLVTEDLLPELELLASTSRVLEAVGLAKAQYK